MFGFDFRVSFERKLWIIFRFFVIFILNFNPCHHRFHVHQSASTKEFVDFSLVRGGVCEALRIMGVPENICFYPEKMIFFSEKLCLVLIFG